MNVLESTRLSYSTCIQNARANVNSNTLPAQQVPRYFTTPPLRKRHYIFCKDPIPIIINDWTTEPVQAASIKLNQSPPTNTNILFVHEPFRIHILLAVVVPVRLSQPPPVPSKSFTTTYYSYESTCTRSYAPPYPTDILYYLHVCPSYGLRQKQIQNAQWCSFCLCFFSVKILQYRKKQS